MTETLSNQENIEKTTQDQLQDLKSEIVKTKEIMDKVNDYLSNNEIGKKLLINSLNEMLNIGVDGFYLDGKQNVNFYDNLDKKTTAAIFKIAKKIGVNDNLIIDTDDNAAIDDNDIIIGKNTKEAENKSTGELFEQEKNQPGTLKKLFLCEIEKNKFKVDFKGNKSAEKDISIGDILEKKVKKISITDNEGKSNIYTRAGLKGNFYDENNEYGDVLNGFEVKILEEIDEKNIIENDKKLQEKIQEALKNPKIKDIYEKGDPKVKERILQVVKTSLEYDVKPELIIGMWQAQNPELGEYMGINKLSIDTFQGQLVILCRQAQNADKQFKKQTGKSDVNFSNKESGEYIYYLSSIEKSGEKKSKNILMQLLEFIGAIFGLKFDSKDFFFIQSNLEGSLKKDIEYNNYYNKGYKKQKKSKNFQEGLMMTNFEIGKLPNNNKIKNFDYNSYKESIAQIESNGFYGARNDKYGKQKKVKPSNWAFGRYQFTAGTLKDYKIDFIDGNDVNENELKKWTEDKKSQENVMIDYTWKNAEFLMKNYSHVIKDDSDLATLLSVCHHSGRGGVIKYIKTGQLKADWLGGKTSNYKQQTAALYYSNKNNQSS